MWLLAVALYLTDRKESGINLLILINFFFRAATEVTIFKEKEKENVFLYPF